MTGGPARDTLNRMEATPVEVRLVRPEDLAALLAIENWAIEHTAANFNTAPLPPEALRTEWESARGRFPWFAAEDPRAGVVGFARSSPHRSRCAYAWTVEVLSLIHI